MIVMDLSTQLQQRIQASGPLPLDSFQEMALYHPELGYYATQKVLGKEGDFTTAPEVSQLFGEMVAIFLWDFLLQLKPSRFFHLLELGPGRGVLMADLLRTWNTLSQNKPALHEFDLSLLEISPFLRQQQAEALQLFAITPQWAATLEEALSQGEGPLIVVANEFWDTFPVKQYLFQVGEWRERAVDWNSKESRFQFTLLPPAPESLPKKLSPSAPEGAIRELSPAREAIFHKLCYAIVQRGGLLWLADYGYTQPRWGDTLQGLFRGKQSPVLEHVGQTDLSAHVDFESLATLAREAGLRVAGPVDQRAFLNQLGIQARLQQLQVGKSASLRASLEAGCERLTHPLQMGTLFKVMAVVASLPEVRPAGFS